MRARLSSRPAAGAGSASIRRSSVLKLAAVPRSRHRRYCFVREVELSGAAILVRHDLLKRLSYLDERYFPGYYEDTDLCFGARSLGYKVMYCPFSVVVHHEGASSGRDLSRGMKTVPDCEQTEVLSEVGRSAR